MPGSGRRQQRRQRARAQQPGVRGLSGRSAGQLPAEGGPDPVIEGAGNTPSSVSTNLTLVPCGADFENLSFQLDRADAELPQRVRGARFGDATAGRMLGRLPARRSCLRRSALDRRFRFAVWDGDPPAADGRQSPGSRRGERAAHGRQTARAIRQRPTSTSAPRPDPPSSCVTVNSEIRLPTFP